MYFGPTSPSMSQQMYSICRHNKYKKCYQHSGGNCYLQVVGTCQQNYTILEDHRLARCKVYTVVLRRIQVFLDVMVCQWVSPSHCFKESRFHNLRRQ